MDLDSEWIEFGIVAGLIGLAVFAAFLFLARRQEATARRLADPDVSSHDLILGDMTEPLAEGMPARARDLAEIQPELTRAGYYSPTSFIQYRAIRALFILVPLVAAGLVTLVVDQEDIPVTAVVGLAVAGLGYSLPRVYIGWRARGRSRQIEVALPVFADLLTLALLAGQNIYNALRRVATEIRPSYPVMADELGLVIRQAELNTLVHAFEQWADRCQVPDVRNLVMVLSQAQRMGTDITAGLMEYSNNIRANLRQRAEAQAQRAGLWMLFPNILCLWVPAAVILIAPLAFDFADRREKAKATLREQLGGKSLEETVKQTGKARPGVADPNSPNKSAPRSYTDSPGMPPK